MYKFGLVGCGRISGKHIEALAKLKEAGKAELVACCDIVQEKTTGVNYKNSFGE